MIENLILALEGLPAPLRVILLSMLPISEYQLSIPLGIHAYQLSPVTVLGLAIVASASIFFPLYFGLEAGRNWLARCLPRLVGPVDALLSRSQAKLAHNYSKYGMLALFIFLAVPWPLTGVWTATLAAVALKIPLRLAFIGILSGALCGASVITVLTVLAERAITLGFG